MDGSDELSQTESDWYVFDEAEQFIAIGHNFFKAFAAELGPYGMHVYIGLKYHVRTGNTHPLKHKTLANLLGISRETVQRQIAHLKDLGFVLVGPRSIEHVRRLADGTEQRTVERLANSYTLVAPAKVARARARAATATVGAGEGVASERHEGSRLTDARVASHRREGRVSQTQHELDNSLLTHTHTSDAEQQLLRAIAQACFSVAPKDLMPADGTAVQNAAIECARRQFTVEDVRALVTSWSKEEQPYPSQIVKEIQRLRGRKRPRRAARAKTESAPAEGDDRRGAPEVGAPPPWATPGGVSPITGQKFE